MNNTIYGEGLHFKIPFVSTVIKTNIQTQKFESDADSASKDLQSITTRIAVNGRIDEKAVRTIYKELGGDVMVENKVVNPSVQEAVKSVTAKYTAEELITKR
jgi:prohibitin 2